MKILIALAIVIIIAVGAWDLRDGSFDLLSGSTNKYGSFLTQINIKDLPFKVLTPQYIPPGFKFLKEESANLVQGNIGIPQINYLFESSDGKNGLVLKQFDKVRYQKDILEKQGIADFQTYLDTKFSTKPVEQGGRLIYIKIPSEKVRSILGDMQYIASAHMVNDDSFIELNYSGETPFFREELIKILLSFQ